MGLIFVRLTGVLPLLLMASGAMAAMITVEPDDYSAGQSLENVVAGVTLRVANGSGVPQENDDVQSFSGNYASTGSLVFGKQVGALAPTDSWFLTTSTVHTTLRVDFDVPVNMVSIDVIRSSAAEQGAIMAFNDTDTLLDTAVVDLGATGTFTTATINDPSANIAYVLIGGYPVRSGPPWNVVALDNLRFNVVPLPTAALMLGSALGLLGWLGRRTTCNPTKSD